MKTLTPDQRAILTWMEHAKSNAFTSEFVTQLRDLIDEKQNQYFHSEDYHKDLDQKIHESEVRYAKRQRQETARRKASLALAMKVKYGDLVKFRGTRDRGYRIIVGINNVRKTFIGRQVIMDTRGIHDGHLHSIQIMEGKSIKIFLSSYTTENGFDKLSQILS